ncbi:acyltransferase [Ructibacterium gallinarum]|uniref:Acyltransferase n=1 Tax=Ructibacterium gallinarum TaxID=2779355 RepID=A0A9D5M155_9FIRM|nr:acyltransferase [Ructibacterium gallinarum]MBE5040365.1 acyltransferase [Ructibacterium gallinarum]
MKRKITEISVFEFFLCMFVILIHLLSEGVDTFPKWSFWSILFSSLTRLTTFAVPGFIFTSAIKLFYKYNNVRHFPYMRFLWDRLRKICFPYFLAVIIYYAVFIWIMDLYQFSWEQLLYFILSGNISAQFYFIILIIQFYLLMPIWIMLSRIDNRIFTIVLTAVACGITIFFRMYFPYADVTHKIFPSYLVFWLLGMYVGLHYETFERLIIQSKPIIYIGWLVLAITHCVLSYMQFGGLIAYNLSPVIVVFFCFFSIFGFYSYARELTISLERRGKGLLTSISQASYDIYLIHCLIIIVMGWLLTKMEIDNTLQRFAIIALTTYGLSIIFCVLQATIYANLRAKYLRSSATRARKMARRKRYL